MIKNPEIILVVLGNGASALFINADVLCSHTAGEDSNDPASVGEILIKSLGGDLTVTTFNAGVPADPEWSWNDVYASLPPRPALPVSNVDMEFSVDGGETFHAAPEGVRLSIKTTVPGDDDEEGLLTINVTHEGIISDLWVSRDDHLDHNLGTKAEGFDDLLVQLANQN